MSRFKAFTIVEMLVVVAIIAILATVMTISIGNSVVQSRDGKRMADITMIDKAIGLYAAEKRQFPQQDPCVSGAGANSKCIVGWQIIQGDGTSGIADDGAGGWKSSNTTLFKAALNTYLPNLPTDPKNQPVSVTDASGTNNVYYNYLYYSADRSTYYLRARLELPDAGNFGLKTCFGFLGSKSSAVTQATWTNAPVPGNGCI